MLIPLRYRRRITLISAVLGLFLIYHFISTRPDLPRPLSTFRSNLQQQLPTQQHQPKLNPDTLSDCPLLPGIEDVLVVMKTGVTEALDKVPVHFETTLRCIPNYVIFSDFEEEIAGVRIHDALSNMDPEVKRTVPDFDLYNRLQKLGRKGLGTQDFADEANSAIGKPNNPGWKLDKWKFLPMVQEALRYKNDAKWYVFMEADTYFAWPTLLEWLSNYDPQKPLYIGTETQIADVIFAHGGSGFIISRPALQLAADEYAGRSVELDMFTDEHWAGDCVLGKVLLDAGVPLTYSWPILQNSNVGELDPFTTGFYRQPWCFPAVAFHHLSPRDIRNLWEFEQRRWKSHKRLLLHSDVFKELTYPELSNVRDGWDNLSGEEHASVDTFHECQSICLNDSTCVQFALRAGSCFTGKTPRLGVENTAVRSGWVMKRIERMVESAPSCPKPDFGL
ncbi:isoform 2 of glycoprotein-N-acetylgalactosamine 3-beta-galactosyltransferase 1 [Aspergillus udagawae]|uniref:N-acetylgalactosaminide beta-1,3-galactosyltransferase n=1 Tax=Aspergillus udagawae TaxID=91492 RepID=A0ABQ1AQZ8_9EURO|nr:isoform 2 of glycoprotein-N-acetylgalactosamine 3-beta-galactosyltransferase 1 [Aspergillus udagawae]GFF86496.1 isoform 2 of glycoprotein-N-acetylgalactosamine 3-beta-galactosyltransferase 1 [Aspergillus udagawae]GFG15579.1 isoform 2 of glycoprotein-N-acetylgalactosamine 3-beta-galactosyltransferase 1 [Aspergillus udagawae]GFG25181.1 isoform 2 of glycoprotein-N-acetylgalactosamine 3-beta-galactosyltransferase 1 [Aspergillus udagawae]